MIMGVRRCDAAMLRCCDAVPLRSRRSRHQKQHRRNAFEHEEKQAHPIHLTDRIEQNSAAAIVHRKAQA